MTHRKRYASSSAASSSSVQARSYGNLLTRFASSLRRLPLAEQLNLRKSTLIALILLAWAAALSNVLALVWLPAFVVYMNRFQISPEERVLASRYAQDYAEYRAKTRRWL